MDSLAIARDQSDYQAHRSRESRSPKDRGYFPQASDSRTTGTGRKKVGEKIDQVEQDIGRDRAQRADHYRNRLDARQMSIRCKSTS